MELRKFSSGTPRHIRPWVEYVNYQGDNFDGYWVAAWRFFRCSPLDRSNFKYIKDHLLQCGNREGIELVTFSDALMLCRYYILVHESNQKALRMADMFAERIKRKGSLDPDMEVNINARAIQTKWRKSTTRARVEYCRESGVSVFAARRDTLPPGDKIREVMGDI
jgi:hypothetical protein